MILTDQPILHIGAHGAAAQVSTPSSPASPNLEEAQAEHIRWALEKTGGVIEGERGAAQLLGLKPSTLRFRMKRLGIRRPT